MKQTYTTPTGDTFKLYENMLEQTHVLVAGQTGSGKSVIINGIINAALYRAPFNMQFILIDPKRVELVQYKKLPHTIVYASEPDTMVEALETAMNITDSRYTAMQANGMRKYPGGHVYVIIDELADLMTTQGRKVAPLIQRLCQIGRAANVHVIAATQCPLACVIPTPIKVNFDTRVALKTASAQHSRNIMESAGCEALPRYGQCYYITPEGKRLVKVPMVADAEIDRVVNHWLAQEQPAKVEPKTRGFFKRLFA